LCSAPRPLPSPRGAALLDEGDDREGVGVDAFRLEPESVPAGAVGYAALLGDDAFETDVASTARAINAYPPPPAGAAQIVTVEKDIIAGLMAY
jgi:hypothetical protein